MSLITWMSVVQLFTLNLLTSFKSIDMLTGLLSLSCSVISNSFVTPCILAHQAPLSMGFPKQVYWSGLPFPSPGDLPDPGIEPISPTWQANFLPLNHQGSPLTGYSFSNSTVHADHLRILFNYRF